MLLRGQGKGGSLSQEPELVEMAKFDLRWWNKHIGISHHFILFFISCEVLKFSFLETKAVTGQG